MKKIIGIILAMVMLVTVLPVSAAKLSDNAPKADINYMKNGGFEELAENGFPVGVGAYAGLGAGYVKTETENVHSGKNAIRITTEWGKNAFASMQTPNLIGGNTVELSFWYKLDLPDRTGQNKDANFGIKFEGYVYEYVRADQSAGAGEFTVSTGDKEEWTQAKIRYTLDKRASMIVTYFRLYNCDSGTLYVDDAEIKIVGFPDISFKAKTDQIFYYTDVPQKDGYAEVTMDKNFVDEGYTVDYKFMDGTTLLSELSSVKFTNYVSRFTYPLSFISEKEKEYRIEITVKDNAGNTVETFTQYVYKYDRPKALDKRGVYTDINGKVVRPVMNYHMAGFEDQKAWSAAIAAGINVVQYVVPGDPNKAKADLDWLYENGCYAAVVCYFGMRPAGHDANAQSVRNTMSAIKDHPAVFCWMTMDEPYLHYPDGDDDLRKSYILLRSFNDHTPVYICEVMGSMYDSVMKYCDILGPDPYPSQYNNYGTFVPTLIEQAKIEAAEQDKLVMGILQCCTVGTGTDPKGTPTAVQVHSMIMQNYLAGANAHGWYAWIPDFKNIDKDLHESPYWDALMAFHEKEEEQIYKYFVDEEYKMFNVDKPGDIQMQTGDIWYETWTDGKDVYGIVQNRRTNDMVATVSLTSENEAITIGECEISVVYNGAGKDPVIMQREGEFDISLEPCQAVMIKIDPKEEIDFTQLDAVAGMDGYEWAEEAINFLYDSGIEKEVDKNSFAPGDAISRGDFAKFLIRTLGMAGKIANDNFADVDPESDYATEISIGKALLILNGVGDNKYLPEESISRQDLMVICARGMRCVAPFASGKGDLSAFSDADMVADYAVKEISAMIDSGIIRGNDDGTLNPLGNTTRAEAAVIMQRIYDWKN